MLNTWYFILHFGRQSISTPQINVSNYALNHFLVQSRAKESLRSAKNVVFSLFCILVGRSMGGGGGGAIDPLPSPGYATGQSIVVLVDSQASIKALIKCTVTSTP